MFIDLPISGVHDGTATSHAAWSCRGCGAGRAGTPRTLKLPVVEATARDPDAILATLA